MTAIPSPRPPLHPVSEADGLVAPSATVRALGDWLAASSQRPVAVIGPVGIGKTTLLRRLTQDLLRHSEIAALQCNAIEGERGVDLLRRVQCALETLQRSGETRLPLLLIDDVDRVPEGERAVVLSSLRRYRGARLVVTATSEVGLDDVIALPLSRLTGPVDVSVANFAALEAGQIGRFFLDRVRHHNPTAQIGAADFGHVAVICASSFGIPAELGLLAELVDRHGLATVADALITQAGSRQRLAVLVEALGGTVPVLDDDDVLVMASLFASPGGACADMLRETLPHCDVDRAVRSLTARGLIFDVPTDEDENSWAPNRYYHLRVSATYVGSWCAAQPEISLAAMRHAQADYLHPRIRRLADEIRGPAQRAALAGFRAELLNLRCTVPELIAMGRRCQALALLADALPLLERTCGLDTLLPDVLRLVREYDPPGGRERELLATVAVRVFAAAGELELASTYLDQMEDERPDTSAQPCAGCGVLLRLRTSDRVASSGEMTALSRCIADHRAGREIVSLTETVSEYLPRLLRAGEFERAEAECRAVLSEATRSGDDQLAGLVLFWRAVVACATNPDAARGYVERALAKLRQLGPEAVLSAVNAVAVSRHLRSLTLSGADLAMVIGALSRSDHLLCECVTISPVLPAVERRIARLIGARSVLRWAAAGAAADPVDVLVEVLRRRWIDGSAAPVELRYSGGVTAGNAVEPGRLSGCSELTAREAQVASLVATGLTNRQVAFRLQISEWTVINHLRQVMRKLNCSSRVQVARWVSESAADVTAGTPTAQSAAPGRPGSSRDPSYGT